MTLNAVSGETPSPGLNLIGGGRVACSLARWLQARAGVRIQDVLTRSLQSAEEAVACLGAGRAVASVEQLRRADYLMLAVPDSRIPSLVERIAEAQLDLSRTCVFHTSGLHGVEVLESISSKSAGVAAVHPLRAFNRTDTDPDDLDDMLCLACGEEHSLAELRPLFHAARWREISGIERHRYHAGAVMLSNHLRALAAAGESALESSGVSQELAREVRDELFRDGVEGMLGSDSMEGLTGPLLRGDIATLQTQFDALEPHPVLQGIYRSMSQQLMNALAEREAISTDEYEDMFQWLFEKK